MPTTRHRRRQTARAPLTPAVRHYLETGEIGHPDPAHHGFGDGVYEVFSLSHPQHLEALRARWQEVRDEVLGDWIGAHPGTRPFVWWRLEASEPRRRLGGVGTPKHEVLAYYPELRFGIPVSWVDAWEVEYYNGRARDIHGNRIGTEYTEGHFTGRPIDPKDPPQYESEATYLDRYGLLSAEERAALPGDAFEPEFVMPAAQEETTETGGHDHNTHEEELR
jgi:hypothetical protein